MGPEKNDHFFLKDGLFFAKNIKIEARVVHGDMFPHTTLACTRRLYEILFVFIEKSLIFSQFFNN